MASIFRRKKSRKNSLYSIQYTNHEGKRKTVKGFTDKALTEQLAGKLESDARLRKMGLIDPDQECLAEHRQTSIEDLLPKFEASLHGNVPRYVTTVIWRVKRICSGCGFITLADIQAEPVREYLQQLRIEEKLGSRTYNHYLQALGNFVAWCINSKRLAANPLVTLEMLNAELDIRHPRRALTEKEFSQLMEAAKTSPIRIQKYTGEERARIYLFSFMTGLRKNEMASLTPRSFTLSGDPPTVTVEAAFSKHRRKDVLPLHSHLLEILPDWLEGMNPSERLFPKLDRRKTWVMVKKDLESAGIPYQTAEGIADFHAAGRHTHITELLRNGATVPQAKELARHSDVRTTMKYTHIGIEDQARALASLPVPRSPKSTKVSDDPESDGSAALQLRCISNVFPGQQVSQPVAHRHAKKSDNPCDSKGFVAACHQSSITDKVGVTGFEPATFCTPCRRASQVTLHPGGCFPEDTLLRRQVRGDSLWNCRRLAFKIATWQYRKHWTFPQCGVRRQISSTTS